MDPSNIGYEELRVLTIKPGRNKQDDPVQNKTRNPQLWMPPESAVVKLAILFQCQIDYLVTAGTSDADLPNFLNRGCLRKLESGEIEYDFGPDSYITKVDDLLQMTTNNSPTTKRIRRKRKQTATPQKGCRRKLPMSSTPR